MNIALIILAAGGSTRLGSPKQLLGYQGRSLLRHAAETALATEYRPVLVVLGSGVDRLKDELAGLDVVPVANPEWSKGMGTSIRRGMDTLITLAPNADGVLLTLCDQPLIGPEMLASLARAFREGGPSCRGATATYEGTRGVPALFGCEQFADLRALPDEAGAKSLLRPSTAWIMEVPMPTAAVDIDTREQYARLSADHP